MLAELALASAMVLVTVSMHALGLWGLQTLFRRHLHAPARHRYLRGVGIIVLLVLGLFVLHGLEIWSYGVLYHLLKAVPDFRTAIYFSTSAYGTTGFNDAEIAPKWALIGAIEGINGILLLGWTTAFFVTVMTRLQVRRRTPAS